MERRIVIDFLHLCVIRYSLSFLIWVGILITRKELLLGMAGSLIGGLSLTASHKIIKNRALHGGGIRVHSLGRYYQDAAGKPVFLMGYYDWAAVPDGYYIDHPSRYREMMRLESPYHLNYIRISLGVNRMSDSTHPPSWNGAPTPVPFLYVNTGRGWKADLSQWDPVFWKGLHGQCEYAKKHGFITHLSIFDGVELRQQGGASFGYQNSFWNPSNQTKPFYPQGDYSDLPEGFYRFSDFQSNNGIGFYQRKLIDKVCWEMARHDNVFFELGNELLSSNSAWNEAVIRYIRTKTLNPVSQENNGGASNRAQFELQGWSQHDANTSLEVKRNLESIVGRGYPAWEDPDGPRLCDASSDELRAAAWRSLTGGAAGFGGFSTDFWNGGRGFQRATAQYYGNLLKFLWEIGVSFAAMIPRQEIVGNPDMNSCLANVGKAYVVYIPEDAQVSLDLRDLAGNCRVRVYNPISGEWGKTSTMPAGDVLSIKKPRALEDWVIHAVIE